MATFYNLQVYNCIFVKRFFSSYLIMILIKKLCNIVFNSCSLWKKKNTVVDGSFLQMCIDAGLLKLNKLNLLL